jgi:hypothetical protein
MQAACRPAESAGRWTCSKNEGALPAPDDLVERVRGPVLPSSPTATRADAVKPRFSIARLLGVIAACGVGFAALRDPSEWWASITFTSALLGLAFAALYSAYRTGPRRAYWSAFTAFGLGYMLLAFGPWCETAIRPRLLTTRVLDFAYLKLNPPPNGRPLRFSPDGRVLPIGGPDATARIWGPDPTRQARFETIGHSVTALLLAGLAGLAARRFHARRDDRHRETAEKAAGIALDVLKAGL